MRKIFGLAFLAFALVAAAHADGPAVGSKAPDFSLMDTNGKMHTLADYKGRTVVLEWTNFGCPFVRKHYGTGNMQALQKKWTDKGVEWLSICSSAEGTEGYMGPAEWNKEIAEKKAASTAFLMDAKGNVGKTYGAKTTPTMFVINPDGTLIYKGAIDDRPTTRPQDVKGAKNFVDAALTESLAGKPVSLTTTQSYGCSIKYAK